MNSRQTQQRAKSSQDRSDRGTCIIQAILRTERGQITTHEITIANRKREGGRVIALSPRTQLIQTLTEYRWRTRIVLGLHGSMQLTVWLPIVVPTQQQTLS
jgi:hypothetical protein